MDDLKWGTLASWKLLASDGEAAADYLDELLNRV